MVWSIAMGKIDINWDSPDETLLIITFHSGWTIEEYSEALTEMRRLVSAKQHHVYLFIDVRNTRYSRNLASLARAGTSERQPNVDLIIIITNSPLWQTLFRAIKPILPPELKFRFAHNLEIARNIIQSETTG
jgi:hypothetical protein